jgi:hypothetical protein
MSGERPASTPEAKAASAGSADAPSLNPHADDHADVLLLLECKQAACGRRFLLCSRCFRGQRYCSRACASAARRESVLRARATYELIPGVKERRLERARERYRRRAGKPFLRPDQASTEAPASPKVAPARVPPSADDHARAEAPHVHRPQQPARSASVEDAPRLGAPEAEPAAHCSRCGRPGAIVRRNKRSFLW